jgi:hypothetical protein
MNIPVHHGGGKEVTPAPDKSPLAKVLLSEGGYVKVRALNALTGKIGKPLGAIGFVFAYVMADVAPESESEYTERVYVSGGIASVKFDGKFRGKKIQCRLYWVNTVGDQSPWSHAFEVVIP